MSVVCLGELLIDFVANESGVTVGEASGFLKKPGGAPANVAVAVKRLGNPSAFLTQVGDDPFGHYLAGVLDAEGVDRRGVRFSPAARTALAFVSLAPDGDRSFMFYRHPSADMLMQPQDINLEVIDAGSIFHFGSITLISEPSRSATIYAIEYARSRGKLISYDPNLRLALWPTPYDARTRMAAALDYPDIVKVSDEEVEFLGRSAGVMGLWSPNIKAIIVTHGAGGATLYERDAEPIHVPGYTVNAVDTTGAGDAFVAGILTGLLSQDEPRVTPEMLRFANAVGALTTTQYGAIPALPTMEQVKAFMDSQRA